MKLLEHYSALVKNLPYRVPLNITVAAIAKLLSCTERNAKIIIRKLHQAGWIEWKAGRGRGNRSEISLLADRDDLVIQQAKAIAAGDSTIDKAIQFTRKYDLDEQLHKELIRWFFFSSDASAPLVDPNGKDTIRFPSYRSLPVLDPLRIYRRTENHIMRHIFDTLVTYDEQLEKHVPQLAHSWSHNDTFTQWVFHLRKGVQFHNGKEMTAADVCYSLLRHRAQTSPFHSLFTMLEAATPADERVVMIDCSAPCPSFLAIAASLGGSIVPEESRMAESFSKLPIGTGPFRIKLNNSNKLTLEAFPNYYGYRPLLDEVSLYFLPQLYDSQNIEPSLGEEQANFYPYPYLIHNLQQYKQERLIDRGAKILALNLNNGILAVDQWLRKAIATLLPAKKLIKELKGNRFAPASRLLLEHEVEREQTSTPAVSEWLRKSSYRGETLKLFSYHGAGNENDARWIRKQLGQAGISVSFIFFRLR